MSIKLDAFKCPCCEDTHFELSLPYMNVFPSMEDDDGYVLKFDKEELQEFMQQLKETVVNFEGWSSILGPV